MRGNMHSTMRRLSLAALALLCALALLPLGARPMAAATPGTLSGRVVHGGAGGGTLAAQQVTLRSARGALSRDLATATTDAQGSFSFAGLVPTGGPFTVVTQYKGGTFASPAVQLGQDGTATTTLTVYETTSSDAALSIALATVLVREVRARNGLVSIAEFYNVHNTGTTAFVGTPAPANGKPMGLFRFALPAGATNLTTGAGFDGVQVITVATGFGALVTIPPGTMEFAFAFDAPYDGTTLALPYKAEYATEQVAAFVPPALHAQGQGYTVQGTVPAFNGRYQTLLHGAVAAGQQAPLTVAALPQAGEATTLTRWPLAALAGLLALLLLVLVVLFARRGALPAPLRAAASPLPTQAPTDQARRTALLRALLALEQSHAAGRLSQAEFEARTEATRAELRALLAEDAVAAPDALPTGRGGAQ